MTASVVTDTNGAQRLAFSSNSAAFQVGAGNKTANSLLGNFKIAGQPEGAAVAATVTGGTVATAAGTGTVALKVIANGVEQTLSVDITGATAQLKVDAINTALDGAATATGLHATLDGTPSNNVVFTGTAGESFKVATSGDSTNALGMGKWSGGFAGTLP